MVLVCDVAVAIVAMLQCGDCSDRCCWGMADWSWIILLKKKDEKDYAVAYGSIDGLDWTDVVELI